MNQPGYYTSQTMTIEMQKQMGQYQPPPSTQAYRLPTASHVYAKPKQMSANVSNNNNNNNSNETQFKRNVKSPTKNKPFIPRKVSVPKDSLNQKRSTLPHADAGLATVL